MGKTKIEQMRPVLHELAEQLGGAIEHRGKTWWFEPLDRQLIYERDSDGSYMDWERRLDVAETIMRRILDARQPRKWGSLNRRIKRLLGMLEKDLLPKWQTCYRTQIGYRHHQSGDCCSLFVAGRWHVMLHLVGMVDAEGVGATADEAMTELREKLASDSWRLMREPPKRCGECRDWRGLKGCGHYDFFGDRKPPDYASAQHAPSWCPRKDTPWRIEMEIERKAEERKCRAEARRLSKGGATA